MQHHRRSFPSLARHVPLSDFVETVGKELSVLAAIPGVANAGSAEESDDIRRLKSYRHATLLFIISLAQQGGCLAQTYALPLLDAVFAMQETRIAEIHQLSTACLCLLPKYPPIIDPQQPQQPYFGSSSIARAIKSPSWHIRLSVYPVIQIQAYLHVFTTPLAGAVTMAIEGLLDDQIEVRVLAKKTLTGLIRGVALAEMKQIEARFNDLSRANRSPKERHAGVLGMTALIESSPYDVPVWLPSIIYNLSRLQLGTKEEMLKKTIHSCIVEFWRTHRDQWEYSFKERFTDAQIDALNDLSPIPSYFA